jgi:hypothetical protein
MVFDSLSPPCGGFDQCCAHEVIASLSCQNYLYELCSVMTIVDKLHG